MAYFFGPPCIPGVETFSLFRELSVFVARCNNWILYLLLIIRPRMFPHCRTCRVLGGAADACRDDSAAAGEILTFESIYKSRLYAPRATEFAHCIAPHLCQTPSKAVTRAPNSTQLQSWDQLRNSDYFQNQSSWVDLRWVGRSDHALRHKRKNEQRHTD